MQYQNSSIKVIVNGTLKMLHRSRSYTQQELSYRKQIARQLRTQYVEGIYDSP